MLYAHETGRREESVPAEADLWWLRDITVWIYATIVRRWTLPVFTALILALLAVGYVLVRSPSYTAATQIQMTNLRLTNTRDDSFFAEVQIEPRFMDTQLQIMRSENVGYAVVDNLNLTQRLKTSSFGWLSVWLKSAAPPAANAADTARKAALRFLQLGMSVQQVGLGEVVEIRFTASDPDLAAQLANGLFQAYLADQEQARNAAAQTGTSWLRERLREVGPRARALTVATPPKDSSNPRGVLILAIATFTGLLVGAGIALGRDLMDQTVRTPEQLGGGLAGEFLGVLPHATTSADVVAARGLERAPMRQIVSAWTSRSQRRSRTLGVVSTFRREGRSYVAQEIARTLAIAKHRVLLIDADPAGNGHPEYVSEGLAGLIEWCNYSVADANDLVVAGDVEGLSLLPAGGGGVNDLVLWGDRFELLLESLHNRFDFIVVDLPPLSMSADARAASALDDYLLVVKWGEIKLEHVKLALAKLSSVRHKLIGFVLNEVNLKEARMLPSTEFNFLFENGATK